MNEADTRAEYIDPQLKEAGWGHTAESHIRREYPISAGEIKLGGTRGKALVADYVLIYRNVKLAAIEAKRIDLDVSEGVAQAKLYARKLDLDTSFAANGREIYQICHKTGDEGKVEKFPTPQELWEKACGEQNEWMKRFQDVPINPAGGIPTAHYYQEVAVNRVLRAIANEQQRVLLTLATGTGKTFIASQIAWKLFKSRWNLQRDGKRAPRILFLTDRNFLADQSRLEFRSFPDDALVRITPEMIRKKGEVPKNASVFFTIFQTFMSGNSDTPYFGDYEPDFFDLIIIDECHRGGARDESDWRTILDHFDRAVHLGLTATPRRDANVDTYDYFGEPAFVYSLKEGIKDGYLTPFKLRRIESNIDEYTFSPGDEEIEGHVDKSRLYQEPDFNRTLQIEQRERKRVEDMLEVINPTEKTVVFCATQEHAALVRDLINQERTNGKDDYCVRVTANDGDTGERHLLQFRDNQKSIPTILTTSRKLTTGMDARNVRNIVLMRPVRSMVEFKQIVGRGTRLCDGKHYFTIIDFVGASSAFKDPEWDGEPLQHYLKGSEEEENSHPNEEEEIRERKSGYQPMVKVRLPDDTVREFKSTISTSFLIDGRPVNLDEFIQHLFSKVNLPQLLGSQDNFRKAWSNPKTRTDLLAKLEQNGCSAEDLKQLQALMDAEHCDLFDVLAYFVYNSKPISLSERAQAGMEGITRQLSSSPQLDFVNFVLVQYTRSGVETLRPDNIANLLKIKYDSIPDAQEKLGTVEQIQELFADFQQHLYAATAA